MHNVTVLIFHGGYYKVSFSPEIQDRWPCNRSHGEVEVGQASDNDILNEGADLAEALGFGRRGRCANTL
jgi:hypothetical protein